MLSILGIVLLVVGLLLSTLYILLPYHSIVGTDKNASSVSWWRGLDTRFTLEHHLLTPLAVKLQLAAILCEGIGVVLLVLDEYIF